MYYNYLQEALGHLNLLDESQLNEGKNLEYTINQYLPKIKDAFMKTKEWDDTKHIHPMLTKDGPSTKWVETFTKDLISCDPTYKENSNTTGLYGAWILNLYIKDPESFSFLKVSETLTRFEDTKKYLKNKDINTYKSLEELNNAIRNEASITPRQAERAARNATGKIKFRWENEDWTAYSPLNYDGMLTLGKGTSWCDADSRVVAYYVKYASGDIEADGCYEYREVQAIKDEEFEQKFAPLLKEKGYPDTKDAIYNKYSKRAVLSYYDWGDEGIDDDTNGIELNGLFNPYELEGDNIYVLINKDDPKLKFQIAINKKDYTLADIDDNEIYDLDVLLEEYPELEDFFVNELNILTR